MGDQLSPAEIDALLRSLRRAEDGTGGPAAEASDRDASQEAAASPPGRGGAPDDLARALLPVLRRVWHDRMPGAVVALGGPGPAAGAASQTPTAVARLGPAPGACLWLFWQEAGPAAAEAAEDFLAALAESADAHGSGPTGAALPTVERLGPDTPWPADGMLLPFRALAADGARSLGVGVSAADPEALARLAPPSGPRTAARAAGARPGGAARGVPVQDLELDASVFVGGGMFRLANLASLRPGAVLPLATEVGEPAVVAIGGRVIAYGEVMVTEDETLAVRLTQVVLGEDGRRAAPPWLEQARRQRDPDRAQGRFPAPGGEVR